METTTKAMEKLNCADGGAVAKALETPELLEAMLNCLEPEDLKNARAVARLWRDETLDNFRKSLIYVLDPATESERMLKLTLGIEANAGLEEEAPLPLLYRFHEKPLKRYRLVEAQHFPPNPEFHCAPGPEEIYFWKLCGPHIVYLDLMDDCYFFKSSFIDGLIWLFKTCPKLEELRFLPVWGKEEGTNTIDVDVDVFDIEQRIKRIGMLRKLPLPVSKTDLAKTRENPALNLKALSISCGAPPRPWIDHSEEVKYYHDIATHDHGYRSQFQTFLWCMLSFMPNLKSLEIGRLYLEVMEALLAGSLTTGQLIQLETFTYNGGNTMYTSINYRWEPLLMYLEHLDQVGGFLKNLTLKQIPRYHLWGHPRAFRNVLFRIRQRIAKFHFGLKFLINGQSRQCRFDLFNFIFPNLAELTLEFDYNVSEIILFFDFSVFRGTPNLTRFRVKCIKVSDKDTLKKKLATSYLKKGGPGDKWHLLDEVKENEAEEGMQILQGDGDETFDLPVGGGVQLDEIVLEKMKEFYFTGRFTTKAILVFGKWMKNLKEFGIIFDDETIFIPFMVWPGTLRKLTVLQHSFVGEGKLNEKCISELKEMYPEVEIVVEDEVEIPFSLLEG